MPGHQWAHDGYVALASSNFITPEGTPAPVEGFLFAESMAAPVRASVKWKSLLKQGHDVDVDVQIEYPDNSMRPSRYVVNTIVVGKLVGTRFFDN